MKKRELQIKITTLVIAVIGMLLVGTIVFSIVEKWSILDAFYFVTMTATTVGYGDFTPTHDLSKFLTIIYSISIVPLVLYAFSAIAKYQVNRVYEKVHHLELRHKQKEEKIEQEIKTAEKQLKKQNKKLKETVEDLEEHEKELGKQERKLKSQSKFTKVAEQAIKKLEQEDKRLKKAHKKQEKITKKQELEINEHNKELEIVEKLVTKK